MRTTLFFFAMLAGITASAQVTNVAPISANYATKTVSFRVWWNAGSRNDTHLSKVWVWVDYIQINSNNTTSGNTWARATVGTISGGTTIFDGSNRKGFWLEGNASTNYSATLTVQLTNVPNKFNWCAYVSDYPPNAASYSGGTYTLKGTKPFLINAAEVNSNKFSGVINSLTDATGCPGGVGRDVVHNGGTCAPGLTAVGSYCRNLAADGASTNTSCGIEVKTSNSTLVTGCPSGWSIANIAQLECMRANLSAFGIISGSELTSIETFNVGHISMKGYCESGSARYRWMSNPKYHPDLCGASCNKYCVNYHVRYYADCEITSMAPVKCVR
jgi:hypothetical protein